ncbi:hypothetical protein [Burkholderia sp. lig30]|uniref:hypothetical protein n=1 Tax=Burkholderia sp. lig30 TaxID=1192124 RepID=UPI00068CE1AF|nr:hypothetical protein [Burkholderia sp. lig30]
MSKSILLTLLRGVPMVAGTLLLAACASATDVAATAQPNVYTVTTHSRGILLTWAGAHQKAVDEANDYCAQRGMRASVKQESLNAARGVVGQAELSFECHPVF